MKKKRVNIPLHIFRHFHFDSLQEIFDVSSKNCHVERNNMKYEMIKRCSVKASHDECVAGLAISSNFGETFLEFSSTKSNQICTKCFRNNSNIF